MNSNLNSLGNQTAPYLLPSDKHKSHVFRNKSKTTPTIRFFSLGLLSAISRVSVVRASGEIREESSSFALRKNHMKANAPLRLFPSVNG